LNVIRFSKFYFLCILTLRTKAAYPRWRIGWIQWWYQRIGWFFF